MLSMLTIGKIMMTSFSNIDHHVCLTLDPLAVATTKPSAPKKLQFSTTNSITSLPRVMEMTVEMRMKRVAHTTFATVTM